VVVVFGVAILECDLIFSAGGDGGGNPLDGRLCQKLAAGVISACTYQRAQRQLCGRVSYVVRPKKHSSGD
jgi:hypothetical protein